MALLSVPQCPARVGLCLTTGGVGHHRNKPGRAPGQHSTNPDGISHAVNKKPTEVLLSIQLPTHTPGIKNSWSLRQSLARQCLRPCPGRAGTWGCPARRRLGKAGWESGNAAVSRLKQGAALEQAGSERYPLEIKHQSHKNPTTSELEGAS